MAQSVNCTRASQDATTNVVTRILVLVVSLSLSLSLSSALVGAEIHKSVSVIFHGEIVNLPAGKSLHLCDTSTILSEEILHALEPFHAVYINRTFEDNDSDYVLVEGRDGIWVEKPTLKGVYNLTFEDSASASRAAQELESSEDVLSAVQNGIIDWHGVVVDDDSVSQQWALDNTGQFGGTEDADINAPEAWEYETGSAEVKIGILDSGVYGSHEDLIGRVSGDGPEWYHGTFVAGIAGANTNNGIGMAGVNWTSPILSKSVHGFDWSNVHNKILAAVDEGADVLNASWGRPETLVLVAKACAYAHNMDRLFVASAGNSSSSSLPYPAVLNKVLSVAATNKDDELWSSSNHGPDLDVAAPGQEILSTLWSVNEYGYANGTSFASPHVTGLASLLKSHDPNLWSEDIHNIIQLSAKDLPPAGFDTAYGHGRIDAQAAFELMQIPRTINYASASSGYTHNVSGWIFKPMFGIPGLVDGVYRVKRHEVRKDVTFSRPFFYAPAAWGRGAASAQSGYVSDNEPIYNFRNCEVVPGSVTTTGCTMRSYVYEVWSSDGSQPHGFRPVSPSSVVFAYTALGEIELTPVTMTTASTDFVNERVLIQWDDPNPNEQRILINRRTSESGSFLEWAEVGANVTSTYQTSLNELVGSQLYFYKVYPETDHQWSTPGGPEASFRNLPHPPSSVTAYALTRPIGEGGGPSQRIQVNWGYPQNQLANSIQYYKAKIEYPNHSGVVEWKDSLYGTSTQFCATYLNEPVNITMYAVSNWEEQGRPAIAVQVQAGGYEAGCYVTQDPPGGGQNSTPPPGGELGKPALPTEFALSQNYPNPFNPNTSITVTITEPSGLTLTIINALGQHIRTLYDGSVAVGHHEFVWDGRDEHGNLVGSGLYFYRAEAGEHVATRKMILLK